SSWSSRSSLPILSSDPRPLTFGSSSAESPVSTSTSECAPPLRDAWDMFRRLVPEARDQLTAQELQIISEARGHFPGRARSGASVGRADAFSHATRRAWGYVDKRRRASR